MTLTTRKETDRSITLHLVHLSHVLLRASRTILVVSGSFQKTKPVVDLWCPGRVSHDNLYLHVGLNAFRCIHISSIREL
jgi:hypothetical protein